MKYINLILILLVAFTWFGNEYVDDKKAVKSCELEKIGDSYFENKLYEDSSYYYKKSRSIDDNERINEKILESYIINNDLDKAVDFLNNSKLDENYSKKAQIKILDSLLENEEFKKYNDFVEKSDKNIRKEYKKRNYSKYIVLDNIYDDIKYVQKDDKFIVKSENKWKLLNENNRAITKGYDDIIGFSSNMITLKEENDTKIIDEKNDERSNLDKGNYYTLKEEKIVKYSDNEYVFINRAGDILSKKFRKASNFENNRAIVLDNKVKIINDKFNTIKELEYNDFKVDNRNNAIYDNKIILIKDDKKVIYDILADKYSKLYDDIDFSYGEFIAVKKNNKWGYLDQKFEEIIQHEYDLANSFSNGLGIVKKKQNYIIINKDNKILEKLKEEILPFNDNGVSFKKENDKWRMVKLVRFMNN